MKAGKRGKKAALIIGKGYRVPDCALNTSSNALDRDLKAIISGYTPTKVRDYAGQLERAVAALKTYAEELERTQAGRN